MSTHTEGMLALFVNGNVANASGDIVVSHSYSDFTMEDKRRLVLCWNLLHGIDTDTLEKLAANPLGVGEMMRQGLQRWADLDTASTLLSDALEAFDDNPAQDHEVADRIRAFLKGAA